MSCLLMGDELGSATDIDPLCLQGLYTNFHLDRERRFLELSSDFGPKMSPKIGNLEFSWISRRHRVGFSTCLDLHVQYCATVSASNF